MVSGSINLVYFCSHFTLLWSYFWCWIGLLPNYLNSIVYCVFRRILIGAECLNISMKWNLFVSPSRSHYPIKPKQNGCYGSVQGTSFFIFLWPLCAKSLRFYGHILLIYIVASTGIIQAIIALAQSSVQCLNLLQINYSHCFAFLLE